MTHGAQEILDETGIQITHANLFRKFRIICPNTGVTIDDVSQDQILKEMENFVNSVPTFAEKLFKKYYQ